MSKTIEYEVTIGLEVHVQLNTDSKIFCSCSTSFGEPPNTNICPICLGFPGTLPRLNKRVVEYAILSGLALHCTIAPFSKFDRKNYFYPDLDKAYQISQYDLPIARDGYLHLSDRDGEEFVVRINRIHLEEDAGKLIHVEGSHESLVDYNRSGVPLIEIVTEPDIHSPSQAYIYLEALKSTLEYLGVSDCNMEEGSLRCDANISLAPEGSKVLGTKTELKNMNSFRAIEKGLYYEIERQEMILEEGGTITQETRAWDEKRERTFLMRSKEEAHDYRYFPDPDLVPLLLYEEWVHSLQEELPELPKERRKRFIRAYGLPSYDANILTSSRALADFFEEVVELFHEPKLVSNWVMGEFLHLVKEGGYVLDEVPIKPEDLAELLTLISDGTISGKMAKEVFLVSFKTGNSPASIVEKRGLVQLSDEEELESIIEDVIKENPGAVQDFKEGKKKAIGFLVGQTMKKTKGKANPQLVNQIVREKIS